MIDILKYGFSNFSAQPGTTVARVLAVHKERYEIVCAEGITHGRLKSAIYFSGKEQVEYPTTGDFVEIQYNPAGDSTITATVPRKSYFSRVDSFSGQWDQAVAANFDYVFILTSLNQDFNAGRLERYTTLAWQSGATPVVVLTKADLMPDHEETLEKARAIAIGVDVRVVSAHTGQGMECLAPYLAPGKTIVFLGSSGVGKSSLVNALAGKDMMKVNDIREDDAKGRHTTTHRQLVLLDSGVMIIDTPGMRELGMWDVSQGIDEAFSDVAALAEACRFADCRHENEPGCAVKAAISRGELSEKRWRSYLQLCKEARYGDARSEYMRAKQARNKNIAMWNRKAKVKRTKESAGN